MGEAAASPIVIFGARARRVRIDDLPDVTMNIHDDPKTI